MTIAPIWRTEANVFEDKHLKAVDATRRNRMTMIPTKVTIHIVLIFMMDDICVMSLFDEERLMSQTEFLEKRIALLELTHDLMCTVLDDLPV
jgi:hypothetical protein